MLSVKRLGERLENQRLSPAEMHRAHSDMGMMSQHSGEPSLSRFIAVLTRSVPSGAYNTYPIARSTSGQQSMPPAPEPAMMQPQLVRSTHLDQPMVVFGEEGRATIELQGDIDKIARGW